MEANQYYQLSNQLIPEVNHLIRIVTGYIELDEALDHKENAESLNFVY